MQSGAVIAGPTDADEGTIIITPPADFTFGDIETLSWYTYLVSGYIPHVDFRGTFTTVTIEGATVNDNALTGWPTNTWFRTFDGADEVIPSWLPGYSAGDVTVIDADSIARTGDTYATLGEFQTPTGIEGINENTVITTIEIEVDSWMVASEAYVDNILLNGVFYHFELEGIDKGETLTVSGIGLTSGASVSAYWDYATGPLMHHLNTTLGNPDGSFDIEIDVPSDIAGDHYLWITDVETGIPLKYDTPIFVVPKLSLSPSSGLDGDEVTVKGYGFSDENDVTIIWDSGVTDVVLTSSVETDEDGYVTYSFDVPTGTDYGDYYVTAVDDAGWTATKKYTVGASITLTPDEGPTGTVVTVEGRGWSEGETITFTIDGTVDVEVVDGDTVTVGSDGEFTAEVVIPGMGTVTDYELEATESNDVVNDPPEVKAPAHEDFDVTGIPEIVVSPTYGTPGATITVTGSNFTQIAGTEVDLDLWDTDTSSKESDLVIAETKSDGTFEETFTSPAVEFKTYDVIAVDVEYDIDAEDPFKVGLIALIINPVSGEAGTIISITGIGFAEGKYNVTFGTKLYEDYGTVTSGEAISDIFYAPNFEPGTYTLTVSDTDENELTTTYVVTESTYVIANPSIAPNDYNVSLKGYHFADSAGLVDFVIYNSTIEEEMDVWQNAAGDDPADTNTDGNFTAWWEVLDKDILSIGDYTINVTGTKGLLVQIPFSVVAARVSVAPRKAQFDRGDRIQFDIDNDFILDNSYIEIYSPNDILYWSTDLFLTDWWMPVEGLHTVPYYRQTAAANPMELQSDAPMGTWLYIFYDKAEEQLMNGTFAVGASSAAQIDALLEDVRSDLSGLADDLAGITDDLEDDVAALSDEIGGVSSDMDALRDDIVGDLADDIAQATDAGQAALDAVEDLAGSMSDLGDAVGDIADIAGDAAEAAQYAADAADDAVTAAEDAKGAASGLTTLVYGAIGASLIAALAAIVSLMQISKKIAG